jgi:hypothetical protein
MSLSYAAARVIEALEEKKLLPSREIWTVTA